MALRERFQGRTRRWAARYETRKLRVQTVTMSKDAVQEEDPRGPNARIAKDSNTDRGEAEGT